MAELAPPQRAYTVDEIIAMRLSIAEMSVNWRMPPLTAEAIEAQLRTYMDFGIDPADLEAAVEGKRLEEAQRAAAEKVDGSG